MIIKHFHFLKIMSNVKAKVGVKILVPTERSCHEESIYEIRMLYLF